MILVLPDLHLDHRAWLERELSRPWSGDTVVVTHHAPHLEATGPHRTELDPAYASDLAELIESHAPALWVFGHTHRNVSFRIGRTQLVNAGVGYPREAGTDQAGIGFVLREDRVNRQRNEQ